MTYRPDIDGLRAIAVVSVIAYHAELETQRGHLMPGGFFGVDIFFVISGFLITSLLLDEIRSTGSLSLARFYERRARRILPALLVVLLASLPFAWHLLLPSHFVDYSWSLLASVLFGSNFYWHETLQQYGAEPALLKPLLHTWSLAVEEQYYLVFPLMLLALRSWFRGTTIAALSILMGLSFLFALWATYRAPSFSFYMLPSRLWELLAGGVLAALLSARAPLADAIPSKMTLSSLGLILIVYSVMFLDSMTDHPGLVTLLPVTGTVLVIWFSPYNPILNRFLTSRLFVGIGLISYSLYLWHYPVFAFGRIVDRTPSVHDKISWCVLTVLLSVITYHFVEKPFRNRRRTSLNIVAMGTASASVVLCLTALYVAHNGGLRDRFPVLIAAYGKNELDNEILKRRSWRVLKSLARKHGFYGSTAQWPLEFERDALWYGDGKAQNVMIVGDSISKDLFNAFYLNRDLFPGKNFSRFAMQSRVPENQVELLFSSPNYAHSEVVILTFRYKKAPPKQRLSDLIRTMRKDGKSVFVTSNAVEFNDKQGIPLFDYYYQELQEHTSLTRQSLWEKFQRLFFTNLDRSSAGIDSALKEIASTHAHGYLDKLPVVCDVDRKHCAGVTPRGYKALYDNVHWTSEGAMYFGKRIHALGWLKPSH